MWPLSSFIHYLHRQIAVFLSVLHRQGLSLPRTKSLDTAPASNLGEGLTGQGLDFSQGWAHSRNGISLSALVRWGRPGGTFQRVPESWGEGRLRGRAQSEAGPVCPALLRDAGHLAFSSLGLRSSVMKTAALPPILWPRES